MAISLCPSLSVLESYQIFITSALLTKIGIKLKRMSSIAKATPHALEALGSLREATLTGTKQGRTAVAVLAGLEHVERNQCPVPLVMFV